MSRMIIPLWEGYLEAVLPPIADALPVIRPLWPDESVEVNLSVTKAGISGELLEIEQIGIRKDGAAETDEIPAEMSRVDFNTFLLVVDARQLTKLQAHIFYTSKSVRMKTHIIIPPAIRESLGVNTVATFLPKSFSLCRDRQFFHHFLEFRIDLSHKESKVQRR